MRPHFLKLISQRQSWRVSNVQRQFALCVLVDSDDIFDSISPSDMSTGRYTAQRAGIGINAGRNEASNAKIRGGEVAHTGIIPFLRSLKQL